MAEELYFEIQTKALHQVTEMAGVAPIPKISTQDPTFSSRHLCDNALECLDEGFVSFSLVKCSDGQNQWSAIRMLFRAEANTRSGFQAIVDHLIFPKQPARQFQVVEHSVRNGHCPL